MKSLRFILPLFAVLLLVGGGCAALEKDVTDTAPQGVLPDLSDDVVIPPDLDGDAMEKDDAMMKQDGDAMMKKEGSAMEGEPEVDLVFQNRIVLTDVSEKGAQGEGWYGKHGDETRVYASFNVEKVDEKDYFYEGWLICDGKVISTGALRFFDGLYENYFASTDIATPCEKYVLTIEPNDGDPAPADHVMDGVMEGIGHAEPQRDWNDEYFQTF